MAISYIAVQITTLAGGEKAAEKGLFHQEKQVKVEQMGTLDKKNKEGMMMLTYKS